MEGTRKIFRILKVPFYAIIEAGVALVLWGVLLTILHKCGFLERTSTCFSHIEDAYAILVLLIILRNAIHRSKWYVCKNPTKIQCLHCHQSVPVTRYDEERCLNAPFTIYIPRGIHFLHIKSDKIPFYEIAYRPYLQLDCPECGEKQVICPYCHKPIQQDQVKCKSDKLSVCPHCEKKIYTPIPINED